MELGGRKTCLLHSFLLFVSLVTEKMMDLNGIRFKNQRKQQLLVESNGEKQTYNNVMEFLCNADNANWRILKKKKQLPDIQEY